MIHGAGDAPTEIDLVYDFPLPEELLKVMYLLYLYKKPFYKNFMNWINHYKLSNFGILLNREGKNPELVIRRVNISSALEVDFSADKPETDKENMSVKYTSFNVNVKLQFMKPGIFYVYYPIIMMNKLLPPEMLIHNKSYQSPKASGIFPDLVHNQYNKAKPFFDATYKHSHLYWPKVIPFYDDWKIPQESMVYQKHYRPFLQAAFTLDTEDDNEVYKVKLKDFTKLSLGGILDDETGEYINPKILKVLHLQGRHSFKFYTWFNLTVFKDDYMVEPINFRLEYDEETGELAVVVPKLEYTRFHHIVLSEILDKSKLADAVDVPGLGTDDGSLVDDVLDWSHIVNEADAQDLWDTLGGGDYTNGFGTSSRILLADLIANQA
jgi:hypothetical protein